MLTQTQRRRDQKSLSRLQIYVKEMIEIREKELIRSIFDKIRLHRKYRPEVSPPGKPFVVFLKDIEAIEKYFLK